MKIDISPDEYRDLLDLLHMAEWIMHGHETEPDPGSEKYEKLFQKLFALAGSMGLERLVSHDPKTKKYYLSKAFDDTTEAWEFIDDFTDDTFWDELIHRLTDRDLSRKVGGYEQLDKLSMEERFKLEGPIIERYSHEFDEIGLDRLELIEHFGGIPLKQPETHD
jgi:hypothetical protein